MRRLLLIRHGKSSWKFPELADHDRPLNARGERDKGPISQYLVKHESCLAKIITSTAVRAFELATSLSQAMNVSLQAREAMYTFGSGALASAIRQVDNEFKEIAVVGHNPAITELANHLTKAGITNVPTSGIVAITCSISTWSELSAADCELDYFVTPKMLK